MELKEVKVRKKDSTLQPFTAEKIVAAVKKSADRVLVKFTAEEEREIVGLVTEKILHLNTNIVPIETMHNFVEYALDKVNPAVAKSYREYRNYKIDFVNMLDDVYRKSQKVRYIGDKENSNTDSALVATKRSLIYNQLNKELYQKFFLNKEERSAIRAGYIYIHDMVSRLDTMNCCLFDMKAVLTGGFEMANIWYNEPKTLDTAFDVIGDIVLSTAAQQYGGFTIGELDKILAPYAEKSYKKYLFDYSDMIVGEMTPEQRQRIEEKVLAKVRRDMEQGFQGIEYKLNTVGSSRGDYPFITITAGLATDRWGKLATECMLRVHMGGQGKAGFKKPVLFPKIVFLYDEELHGEGKELEDIFELAIECSSKTMYPDFLSLTGEGYVAEIYKKYKKVISPMGCRAFLSPWYERGGMKPADENDVPIFTGRWNGGAISLHLPMIYAKAKEEEKDFYEVLDYYLQMIRTLHQKTYEYLGNLRASVNPLAFCEGGFYQGRLKHSDKIRPILPAVTFSFGITALNELQQIHNGKSLREDAGFALEVMEYINKKAQEFKEEDGILYAIYGTPAESLCGTQVEQFRSLYGRVKNVSDRAYVTNSFHLHVTEEVTPIEKQDYEKRFWDLLNGGKIQYVRYNIPYNVKAIRTLVRRAMKMGFYEGINMALSYCDDCGHQELNMEVCPKCHSENLTKIDRMNGYLSFSRVKGDTRLNHAKTVEISERVTM